MKLSQLMVQETVSVMDERYQALAKERAEARQGSAGCAESTVGSVAGQETEAEEERIELTVKEYVEFASKVVEQGIGKYGSEIAKKA